jgi:hypothetical protein
VTTGANISSGNVSSNYALSETLIAVNSIATSPRLDLTCEAVNDTVRRHFLGSECIVAYPSVVEW